MQNQSLTNMAKLIDDIESVYLDYLNNYKSIADFAKAYNADIEDAILIIEFGIIAMKSSNANQGKHHGTL